VLNNLAPFYCQPRRKLAILVHPLLTTPNPFVLSLTLLVAVQFYCWHFVDCCLFSIKPSPASAKPTLKYISAQWQSLEYFICDFSQTHYNQYLSLFSFQGVATGKYHGAVLTNSETWEAKSLQAGRKSGDLLASIIYCPELHFSEFASAIADMKNSVAVSTFLVPFKIALKTLSSFQNKN